MKHTAYELFKSMYLILDEIWKSNQEEDLRIYLSDANPLFFENGTSLDPAIFEDFKAMYNQKIDENIDDYDFLIYYFDNLDSYYGDIKKYFTIIPIDECKRKIDD